MAAVSVSLKNLVERVGHERIRPHVAPDRTVRAAGGAGGARWCSYGKHKIKRRV